MINFKRDNKPINHPDRQSDLAELILRNIQDGVMITDHNGVVEFVNPAALTMVGVDSAAQALGLDYGLLLKLESKEGRALEDNENPLIQAVHNNQILEKFKGCLVVGQTDKRIPIAVTMLPVDTGEYIITFRDITKELAEEGEQTEFISTASHEMRTPVATIDGYISLALNPQTATIDERARGYLDAAHKASKHLGKLFQDLLDVTKLDDGRIRPHLMPAEMSELVRDIANDYATRASEAKLSYTFGANNTDAYGGTRQLDQVVYGYVDLDFMREIMDNLIENAIKYTPAGGSIYVNVRGDGDRVLINVTDTGMGISTEDLAHIFQKFYRADNSDTRTIGGTGLGLYLVKQRVEAMGGRVWAESAFGEGSTFYVSLPRISSDEYEKRMIAVRNAEIQDQLKAQQAQAAAHALAPAMPASTTPAAPAMPTPAPVPAPMAPAAPAAVPATQPALANPTPAALAPAQPAVAQPAAQSPAATQTAVAQPAVSPQPTPPPAPPTPPAAAPAPVAPTPTNTATIPNNNLNGGQQ